MDFYKKVFEYQQKEVIERLQNDIRKSEIEYDSNSYSGAGRSLARMAYYKSIFMDKEITRNRKDADIHKMEEITPEERINRRLRRLAEKIATSEAKRMKIPEDDKYKAKIAEMSKKIQKAKWFQDATKNAAASGLGVKETTIETKKFVESVFNVYNKRVEAIAKIQSVKNNTNQRQNNNPQRQSGFVK